MATYKISESSTIDYLNTLHKEILEIMDIIDSICSNHSLKYYLIGGSLLGAIRHQGFIPWDDDLDIVLPRKDFDKFIEIIKEEGGKNNLYLRWITTEPNYWPLFAKVCKENTLFQEDDQTNVSRSGIFVDVFPLDFCGDMTKEVRIIRPIINQLRVLLLMKVRKRNWKLGNWTRNILSASFSSQSFHNVINKLLKILERQSHSHYGMFGSAYKLDRQLFPIEWFEEGERIPFETSSYICPKESTKVLEKTFGDDYMQLPPIEQRITHKPKKVITSDGTIFVF